MMRVLGLALQAWLVGLLTAGVLVIPAVTVLRGLTTEPFLETLVGRIFGFVMLIPSGVLMTMTFGLVLSAPLFLLGTLVAVLFNRQVARHPLAMAALAPICTIASIAGIDAATRSNQWAETHGFVEKFLWLAVSRDTMLFAIPVAAAASFFCVRWARESRRMSGPTD